MTDIIKAWVENHIIVLMDGSGVIPVEAVLDLRNMIRKRTSTKNKRHALLLTNLGLTKKQQKAVNEIFEKFIVMNSKSIEEDICGKGVRE